ncbi:hypothetical protein GGR57DRAFT_498692 [Xylariaceae sp. FL1272]|nr:hypothetical protein GGR57DRAFT_498692 [Xylariaceae sp. FL1272]
MATSDTTEVPADRDAPMSATMEEVASRLAEQHSDPEFACDARRLLRAWSTNLLTIERLLDEEALQGTTPDRLQRITQAFDVITAMNVDKLLSKMHRNEQVLKGLDKRVERLDKRMANLEKLGMKVSEMHIFYAVGAWVMVIIALAKIFKALT